MEENLKNPKTDRVRATPYRTRDRVFCADCEKPVKLLTFAQAVEFVRTGLENIQRLAETGALHRLHNRKGAVMICSESLFRLLNERQKRKKSDNRQSFA
jgi:hypothetical protein